MAGAAVHRLSTQVSDAAVNCVRATVLWHETKHSPLVMQPSNIYVAPDLQVAGTLPQDKTISTKTGRYCKSQRFTATICESDSRQLQMTLQTESGDFKKEGSLRVPHVPKCRHNHCQHDRGGMSSVPSHLT